ncbi:uncharacterized protein L199_000791 [Kwoniella botswanensis]|uniref:uncharacterized protein n=1 Tax=Kwoniella botswanensis TaxID=1268659 RepID=UPI00315DBB30
MRGGGSNMQTQNSVSDDLPSLPARFGGVGLLSFVKVAPIAFAASLDWSAEVLSSFIPAISPPAANYLSQRERCDVVFNQQQLHILAQLSPLDRGLLLESASPIGRRWLSLIPSSPAFVLNDFEVSSALTYRSLFKPQANQFCPGCHKPYFLGHFDVCQSQRTVFTIRHNRIQWALVSSLRRIPGADVTPEPPIAGTSLRNDIRLRGSATCGLSNADIDVTIHALSAAGSQGLDRAVPSDSTTTPSATLRAETEASLIQVLDMRAKIKRNKIAKLPTYSDAAIFHPFVLSAGGFAPPQTQALLDSWRKPMNPYAFQHLLSKISLAIVQARAQTMRAL